MLVAVDAVPGPAFVDEVRRVWDAGDAVLPVDARLPRPAREWLLHACRPDEPVEAGDAVVMPTGGTTGPARAAVITHHAVQAAVAAVSRRLAVDPSNDRWLACLPLVHMGGFMVVARALLTGTPLTFSFDARPPATLVSVVPTLLDRIDPSPFRVVLAGGGPDWRQRGPNVIHTYGMTETCGGVVYDGVPLEGVEVRDDDEGELHVRGPTLLRCYRDGSDPRSAGGWLPTGDLGAVVDGRVVVHGRRTEMIVTGGEKVWPDPVEAVLRDHPGVAEVAVLGRPDPEWGERVVAVVVPRHPAAPPGLDELRGWVKERLPAFNAPRELKLARFLARSPTDKIRRDLARRLLEGD